MRRTTEASAVPLGPSLRFWTKLGFISFGGPAGQIALMHEELVERRRWLSERRFTHALNFTMLVPGPEAQQLATYLGWLMHGTAGGIAACTLFVLPSLAVLIALSWVYLALGHVPLVAGVFYGIKPVVCAIVLLAAWRIGKRTLDSLMLWAIALVAFIGLLVFKVPFPAIMIGAAVVGFVASRGSAADSFAAEAAPTRGGEQARAGEERRFVFDDDTPLSAHAHTSRARLVTIVGVTVLLGTAAYATVLALAGAGSTLADIAAFFTKAAFLTFGGAYAVLPYVFQAGVETYGWLGPLQMVDGLALGETTPGPLIMVVAFIDFVGAAQAGGGEALLAAGAMGAAVTTFFTFLPSFAFILIGAPLAEATRHDLRLTGPLKAVTAAVVGVIADLACLFAWHVFVPFGSLDWVAVAVGLVALAAMYWREWSPLIVILCGALFGVVQSLFGVMWL